MFIIIITFILTGHTKLKIAFETFMFLLNFIQAIINYNKNKEMSDGALKLCHRREMDSSCNSNTMVSQASLHSPRSTCIYIWSMFEGILLRTAAPLNCCQVRELCSTSLIFHIKGGTQTFQLSVSAQWHTNDATNNPHIGLSLDFHIITIICCWSHKR